jgi:asparagine synthase (glutamine-hydrolysing)
VCGIASILDIQTDPGLLRQRAVDMARLVRHRGPDWSGVYADERAVIAHERLSIVDIEHGAQPLTDAGNNLVLAVNGEIYNYKALRDELHGYAFRTSSDCEPIIPLYERYGTGFLNRLSGIFAFVLYDRRNDDYLIARDPIGVVPLYTGRDEHGNLHVASEMKALIKFCRHIEDFPPGHYLTRRLPAPARYYEPAWTDYRGEESRPLDLVGLRKSLETAVHQQLMSDVPYGVLISGGLDSSVIAAVTQRLAPYRVEEDDRVGAWWPRLHSFCIGLNGSPDIAKARTVASAIGTVHHEFIFTIDEGLDALRDVIYHTETHDVTSIRASTPMYLMMRKIKAMGIKMVLSGEGADEIFGGYLYFHKAPNAREFHEETVRKLSLLHKYDCLRANKTAAAWGIEIRVPFLDREFLDVAMAFDAREKMVGPGRMEKYPLRKAFEGYLPEEILWRQKEQFSDGVGYGWIDALKDHAEALVTDGQMKNARFRFSYNAPATKEAYLYREIFETCFPGESAAACVPGGPSIACSTPTAIAWDASFARNNDPSGRAVLGVHHASNAIVPST